MDKKERPVYDNYIFADLIKRYIHRELDREVLLDYYCTGKSIMTIANEHQMSTRHIWTIKERGGNFIFDLYDKLQKPESK